MTKRMLLMLLFCLVVFGSVFGMKWFGNRMMNQFVDNMPIPPASISTAVITAQTWENTLQAVGTLVAVNGADLTAEAEGNVIALHFDSGDRVSEGQLLLELDATAEKGELDRLQAQAKLAELNRERQHNLYKRGTISKSQYDTALAELQAANAAVAAQQGRLDLKTLRAPFTGSLGIRRVTVGQHLRAGDAVVTLQALDPIDLDFALPERYLEQVVPGMALQIRVDALGDAAFSGTVVATEPKIDAQTRNFDVRARIANPTRRLKPGLFAKVSLSLGDQRELLAVPRTAVKYSSYGDTLFILQKQQNPRPKPDKPAPNMPPYTDLEVSQRFVTLGEARGDFVEVIDGVAEGEEIATSGLLKLRSGQPVLIENALNPDASLTPSPSQG